MTTTISEKSYDHHNQLVYTVPEIKNTEATPNYYGVGNSRQQDMYENEERNSKSIFSNRQQTNNLQDEDRSSQRHFYFSNYQQVSTTSSIPIVLYCLCMLYRVI